MKKFLSVVAVTALATASLPAWSQTNASPSNDQTQNPPGVGGTSKPGIAGHPGNKSGPDARQSGTSTPPSNAGTATSPSRDESKVPGLPGGKSGPSDRAPGSNTSKSDSSKSR